jgi:hypothetical protein
MSTRRNERLVNFYDEQRKLKKNSTPFVKLLSSEEQEIDGEIFILESWEKKQKFSPTTKLRRYKKGEAVSKIPTRDDPYII